MCDTDTLDLNCAYKVDGHGGIAWRIDGFAKETTGGDCFEDEDGYFSYEELTEHEDATRVRCHMVGDDREWIFDVADLTPISDDDYCSGCGQIGCGHGG